MAKSRKGAGALIMLGGVALFAALASRKSDENGELTNGDGTNGGNGDGGNGNGNGGNGNGGNGGFVPLGSCLDAVEFLQYPRTQAGVSTFQSDWNKVNKMMRNLLPGGGGGPTLELLEGLGIYQDHPLFTGEPVDVDSPYVSAYGTIQVDGDCGSVTNLRAQYASTTAVNGWYVAVTAANDLGFDGMM